jgi:uncharacterized RmlC-like cupin family protein
MNDPVKAPDAAVLALLIASEAHEHELHHTRLQVSSGYSRQRYIKRKTEDASQT